MTCDATQQQQRAAAAAQAEQAATEQQLPQTCTRARRKEGGLIFVSTRILLIQHVRFMNGLLKIVITLID